jgi:N-methylhydantoinase A
VATSTKAERKLRLSIDVGGTFTDICVLNEDTSELRTAKVPSNRWDPLSSVIDAISALDLDMSSVHLVTHSTTITTNALVTRDFPSAAMITTAGFRDVIEMRDGTQEDVWDSFKEVSRPYIARRDRLEISERIDYSGRILTPLDIDSARELASSIKARGIRTVAVCFINSYANAVHEERMREILLAQNPELNVSISSEILPEINEYERFSTTVANALLASLVGDYIGRLAEHLNTEGYVGDLLIMHSGGGSMTASLAQKFPLRLAASSIAGGAMAAKYIAQQCGFMDAIAIDMGGTSTDITLIDNGQVRVVKQWWVEYGHPISFPGVELATIGSGGGTIAWVDDAGALRSGPRSAGAEPGPVSYRRGGTEPTNTDANLVLGRLGTELAGGKITLDSAAAEDSIRSRISVPLGLSHIDAALAIVQIVDAATASAVRLMRQSRKSLSPSAPLIIFGGAGPLHAVAVAKELQAPLVIIPPHPGITSALGCLLVDIRHDFSTMFQKLIGSTDEAALEGKFTELEIEARERLLSEGISERDMVLERAISMRYAGQWRSLSIPFGRGAGAIDAAVQHFQSDYQMHYAYRDELVPVEVYQLNLTATGRLPPVEFQRYEIVSRNAQPISHRLVAFDETGALIDTSVYTRKQLRSGSWLIGPAVIEQLDTTILIPPGFRAEVDEWLNLHIEEVLPNE